MSCGCLTCPGVRDGMGVFNRSKLVGLQGTSSVPEGFIGARRVHKREDPPGRARAGPIKFIRIPRGYTHPTTPEHLLILRTPVPPVEVYQRTKEFKKEKLRFIDPNPIRMAKKNGYYFTNASFCRNIYP